MFENKYPYTDFHELNLDWFLAEFKKVYVHVDDLDATVKQFTDFVTNYFNNLDVQEEINKKLDEMASDGSLSALIQPLFDTYKAEIDEEVEDQNYMIDTQNSRISVLEGRMDTFASLPDGSTAGDAELEDIRVGANGVTYASAGDAVRSQITDLTNDIDYVAKSTYSETKTFNGFINSDGEIINSATYKLVCYSVVGSENIPSITSDTNIIYGFFAAEPSVGSVTYNGSRTSTGSTSVSNVTVPSSGVTWIAICVSSSSNVVFNKPSYISTEFDKLNDLVDEYGNINYTDSFTITQGSISGNGNISSTILNNRARSTATVFVKQNTTVTVIDDDYEISYFYYHAKTIAASNKDFGPSNYAKRFTVGRDTYLAFNIKRVDNADFVASTLNIQSILDIESTYDANKIYYVTTTGSDSNNGKSADMAFATFNKAISEGAEVIYAERGTYNQSIISKDTSHKLQIVPYENNTYNTSVPDRPLITINNGISLDNLVLNAGILSQAFDGTDRFYKVFISHELPPTLTILSYTGYNVGVWQLHSDDSNDKELVPVLTSNELSTAGTVYWDGTTIFIHPYSTPYSGFVVCGDTEYGIDIENKDDVVLEDVCVKYSLYTNIQIRNCMNATIQNCQSLYTVLDDGVSLDNSNVNLYKCMARHSMSDGYNIHEYGESNFFDCESWYNLDDGISHHKGCKGTIYGGQYNFNGKGGNSPTTGSLVNSFNAIYRGNRWGFYSVKDTANIGRTHVVNGNLIVDNQFGIRCSGSGQIVISINNQFSGNQYNNVTDEDGVIMSYPS